MKILMLMFMGMRMTVDEGLVPVGMPMDQIRPHQEIAVSPATRKAKRRHREHWQLPGLNNHPGCASIFLYNCDSLQL
jgi:hypothetical protein